MLNYMTVKEEKVTALNFEYIQELRSTHVPNELQL